MKKLKKKKSQSGITLIALVITIIVLLILAGVSISLIVGENGIVSKAQQAKEKMDFASIKENIEMEIAAIQTENIANKLTESEIIDKLVEKGIVAEDRKTFVSDSNYTISPNGNIFFMGKKVNKVEISDSENTVVVHAEFSYESTKEYYSVVGKDNIELVCHNGRIDLSTGDNGENMHNVNLEKIPVGKKFAYWIDQNSNIFSYNESFKSFNNIDMEYTPVFVDQEVQIEKEPVLALNSSRLRNLEEIGKEKAPTEIRIEGNGYEIIKVNLIRFFGYKCPSNMILDSGNVDFKVLNIDTVSEASPIRGAYNYFARLSLSATTALKNMYVRGVIQYRNPDTGEIETQYTDIFEYEPVK